MNRAGRRARRICALAIAAAALCPAPARAQAVAPLDVRLHTKSEFRAGYAPAASFLRNSGDAWLVDGALTVRPLFDAGVGSARIVAEVESVSALGDTRERLASAGLPDESESDDRRELFDLSRVWSAGDRHRNTLRVDRLAMVFSPSWGTVTVGRHAVTWGGGLVFNPFDLFNPFAPADVVRDFKIGADMLHVDVPVSGGGVQALAVVRRDFETGSVTAGASSVALQVQRTLPMLEWTGMAAWHYGEPAVGMGLGGSLAGAAWRVDGTWVRVQPEGFGAAGSYFSAVANLQYAWVLAGKNTYGVLEFHYNGLGRSDYATATFDPLVATQLARRNVFVLGRNYAAVSLQMEWHPLVSVFASAIVNLGDPSMLLQPRLVWDATASLRVTAGLDIPVGPRGSEFGGYEIPGVNGTTRGPVSGYVFVTWDL